MCVTNGKGTGSLLIHALLNECLINGFDCKVKNM